MLEAVDMEHAIRAIQRDLVAGLDPAHDLSRSIIDLEHGQLLYMPSRFGDFVGAKVSTVAPLNSALGRPRIQGIYLLMDALTLGPLLLMDGRALTTLRTPAVSAAIADFLAPPIVKHLVVFGSGTQARGHVEAMRVIRDVGCVSVVARDHRRSAQFVEELVREGQDARVGNATDVHDAQIIVCATTARTPVLDGMIVPDDALAIAVGSHEPDARELDSHLVARSQVVVEDVTVAMREAGDLLIPASEGRFAASAMVPMRDIITGAVAVDRARPRVFKSSGMPWQDLVVAAEIYRSR
ncbi:MAG: ornithine cyclodeaminase family protein [Acidobacteria bacterium]|nr:ornithine cyclodeaminase family protein [Acidobacteriota bacterium]